MLFGDMALASRIERAECGQLIELTEAVRARGGAGDTFALPLGGGIASYAGPGSPMNKIAGLGFGGEPDQAALEGVEAEYARRNAAVQVEFPSLGDPSIAAMLTRRGYVISAFEDVLGLHLEPGGGGMGSNIQVRQAAPHELSDWMETVITGFAHPDEVGAHEVFPREVIERIFGAFEHAPNFRRYLAFRKGTIAGAATLRVAGGIAQFAGATTLPEHRRRGVQTALFRLRLMDAAAAGCDLAVVTTQPGSKSEQNARRQGFTILYTRVHLRRGPVLQNGPFPGDGDA